MDKDGPSGGLEEAILGTTTSTGVEASLHEGVAANKERTGIGQAGNEGETVAPKRKSHRPSLEVVKVTVQSFYTKSEFKQDLQYGEIARDNIAPHHFFGLDAARPDNLRYIEPGKVMYTAGNALVILDVSTMKRRLIFGLDGRGVGCFAVHPSRTFVAVGEKGAMPNIYIYEYPSFQIAKVLRKGTERGYAGMDFTTNGEKLASVGQAPDFMLTVWNWVQERVILHCKAFSQDVSKVCFSPDDEGRLTTSGTGHIRFWRVARTFTGLKLQGDIGKFGKVEMTDIDCFCHLPDGKVVSGAESGSLLLWEGQFIKCKIGRPGWEGCHEGPILCVSLDRIDMLVITAGADGYIRWWTLQDIDAADTEGDSLRCEVTPVRELFVAGGVQARCVERGGDRGDPTSDHILVTDGTGALWRVPVLESTSLGSLKGPQNLTPTPGTEQLAAFHAGAITGLDTSFLEHLAATCGMDGTVRVWDFLTKRPLEMAHFPRPARCLQWANDHVDPAGHTVVVGFADGVVRVLVRDPLGEAGSCGGENKGDGVGGGQLRRAQTLKPHDGGVIALGYSPNGKLLTTVGEDKKIFFIKSYITAEIRDYRPVGFYVMPSTPTSLCWHNDSTRVMVTCLLGEVAEFDLSDGHLDSVDSSQTFEIGDIPVQWYSFKRRPPTPALELPEEAGGEQAATRDDVDRDDGEGGDDGSDMGENGESLLEEDLEPPPALKVVYASGTGDTFLLAMGGWAQGAIFECSWQEQFPIRDLPAGYGPSATAATGAKPPVVTTLRYSVNASINEEGALLVCGCNDGAVTVRPAMTSDVYARVQAHDGDSAVAAAACSYDGEWLLSCDDDGLLAVNRLRRDPFEAAARELSQRLRHHALPRALSPASPLGSSKVRGKTSGKDKPSAPTATEPAELPIFLSEYTDEGQGVVTDIEGFDRVKPVAQGFGSQPPLIEEEAPDIVGEEAYSIQEDKLKTEDDIRRKEAEAKKEGVRAVIREMQAEFARLVEENASAPPGEKLSDADLLIDPEYEEMLDNEGTELCEEVKREMEYSKEKSELHLAKLRRRFMDDVEMECVTMRALQWDYEVSSFRVKKTNPELRRRLDAVHKQICDEEQENLEAQANRRTENSGQAGGSPRTSVASISLPGGAPADAVTTGNAAAAGSSGDTANGPSSEHRGSEGRGSKEKVSTFEARKAKRHARQLALAKLLEAKPAEDADDPRDVAAIALAEASIGDYKLKSSPDYEVPEEMQLNVSKKQREMVLLEESLHTMRSRFNRRFLALRNIKREILVTVASGNRRLREIDAERGGGGGQGTDGGGNLWEPSLDQLEWPEMRNYVSPEELDAYADLYNAEVAKQAGGYANSVLANLPRAPRRVTLSLKDLGAAEAARAAGTLAVDPEDAPTGTIISTTPGDSSASGTALVQSEPSKGLPQKIDAVVKRVKDVSGMMIRLPAARGSRAPADGDLSALEEEERAAQDMLLRHERRTILEATAENVLAFDEALYDLRRERMHTATHLKAGELKLLVLCQELELLQQFDAKDSALSSKQEKQHGDKKEVVTAIAACKAKLSVKQTEAERGTVLEARVMSAFEAIVPDNHPFHEILMKIFRKKIKRVKKRLGGEGDDDGVDESEEEESEEDDYDFDDDEEEEEVDDSCPPGCDIGFYEKTLELREQRLDHEESLTEIQKAADDLKRNLDRQVTRQRQIDKDLNQTAAEIKAAQADKQAQLNELDVVVSLKLNQLYCMDNALEGQRIEEGANGESEKGGDKPRRRVSLFRPKLEADAGMDTHVLFTRAGLDRLKRRISELVQENKAERNNFKDLHRERGRLEKARVLKEAEMEAQKSRCNEIQVLKFGQLIDLEMVDKVSSGMSQEEARRRVELIGAKHAAELERLEEKNRELRAKLLESTHENTRRLREVADLSSRQFTLEKELNINGGSVALGSRGPSLRKEAEERDRLVALVKLQVRELDAIKAEINLLRRKGGHIYAPTTVMPQQHKDYSHPTPAVDNQMEDAFANQVGETAPLTMSKNALEDSAPERGRDTTEGGMGHQYMEAGGTGGKQEQEAEQQEQQQLQQPESYEQVSDSGAAV